MSDRALFLSRLEFSVALMTEGIEEIGCFALPRAEDVEEGQMIQAVYSLVQKGFMQVQEDGLKLSREIQEILASIKASRAYLFMESGGDEQPQRIIYPGKQAVILENIANVNQDFRLFSKAQEEFWGWIEESMETPVFEVLSRDEAARLMQMNELACQEFHLLQECSYPGSVLGIRSWIEKIRDKMGDVWCTGFRFVRNSKGQPERDLILCQGCANLWFLWCDPNPDLFNEGENHVEVAPDAIETRKEIQAFFWREAK